LAWNIKQGKVELGKNNTCPIISILINKAVCMDTGKKNLETYINILIYYSDYFHVADDVILRK